MKTKNAIALRKRKPLLFYNSCQLFQCICNCLEGNSFSNGDKLVRYRRLSQACPFWNLAPKNCTYIRYFQSKSIHHLPKVLAFYSFLTISFCLQKIWSPKELLFLFMPLLKREHKMYIYRPVGALANVWIYTYIRVCRL